MRPKIVKLREVGPREGFQIFPRFIATSRKIELINALSETGLKDIEITSFVRSDLVPNHADARDVVAGIKINPDVNYSALYLNVKGYLLAESETRLKNPAMVNISASDTFLLKNMNSSFAKILTAIPEWVRAFREKNHSSLTLMVSNSFGCHYEGEVAADRVLGRVKVFKEELEKNGFGLKEIVLADTVGLGNPGAVEKLINVFRGELPHQYLSLHLHNTNGLGIQNAIAAIEIGIDCFDTSIAGMGGCPFTAGAAGNIATEELLMACDRMGIETGLNPDKVIAAARLADLILSD